MTESADQFRPETLVAIDAVNRALTIARRGVGSEDITAKGGRDLVTVTDVAVEDAVRGIVADALGFSVIGEERGGEASADGSPYWLVDPICGTRNFASGIPLYCVNLALVEDDEITVAVCGDPSTGEIDVAERSRVSWGLKSGARHRLTTSEESRTIVIDDGKSKGSRRDQAAQFIGAAIRADRWDFRAVLWGGERREAIGSWLTERRRRSVVGGRYGALRRAVRRSKNWSGSAEVCAQMVSAPRSGSFRCSGGLAATSGRST